jgi:hypothetical protein
MLWSGGICREPSVADRLQNVCPDYGFDDAQAELRAAPALSGRLEAGSTSNLWFRGSQGMRVEIELPQGQIYQRYQTSQCFIADCQKLC